jgi:hypothetical protein
MTAAQRFTVARRVTAEAVGTALLLAAVVGSGIMGEGLSGGNVALTLLANTLATGAALAALILTFGPISGAHFNPAVTLADASQSGMPWREVPLYVAARLRRCRRGARDVRDAALFCITPPQVQTGPSVQRVRRDLWTACGDMGLRSAPLIRRTVRCGRIHYGGLLVHRVDIVRESSRHPGTVSNRYLRRYQASRHFRVHRSTTARRGIGDGALPLAGAEVAGGRRHRGSAPQPAISGFTRPGPLGRRRSRSQKFTLDFDSMF